MLLGETLPHSLPWYFGLTVFIIWLAAMIVLALLIRRRLRTKRSSRHAHRDGVASARGGQPALESGHDVEVW
jgi:hypothetical protein